MTSTVSPLLSFAMEDNVGYLLARVRTRLVKTLDVALAKEGITHTQGAILLKLGTGRFATAADLTRDMYIDSASMTRILDRLERRGLIVRARSLSDRRSLDLGLSADGAQLAQRLPQIYNDTINHFFSGFSSAELALFKGLLNRLMNDETN